MSVDEFCEIIPSTAWDQISKAVAKKASDEIGKKLNYEDRFDCNGTIEFLVGISD